MQINKSSQQNKRFVVFTSQRIIGLFCRSFCELLLSDFMLQTAHRVCDQREEVSYLTEELEVCSLSPCSSLWQLRPGPITQTVCIKLLHVISRTDLLLNSLTITEHFISFLIQQRIHSHIYLTYLLDSVDCGPAHSVLMRRECRGVTKMKETSHMKETVMRELRPKSPKWGDSAPPPLLWPSVSLCFAFVKVHSSIPNNTRVNGTSTV